MRVPSTLLVVISSLGLAQSARAGVQVQLAVPAAQGLPLRVLRVEGEAVHLDRVLPPSASGWDVDLPAGEYLVELLGMAGEDLVALRRSVPPGATVVRLDGVPGRYTARWQGSLRLRELEVRSAAREDSVRWTGDAATRTVWLTPGSEYRLGMTADDGLRFLALWQAVQAGDRVFTGPSGAAGGIAGALAGGGGEPVYLCEFEQRSDGPAVTQPTVDVFLGSWSVAIPLRAPAVLATNRRLIRMSWRARLSGNRVLRTVPRSVLLSESRTFRLGGPLEAHAWAGKFHTTSEPRKKGMLWGVSLVDASGQEIDQHGSDIAWDASIRRIDGQPIPGNPLRQGQLDALGHLPDTLEIRARWRLEQPVEVTLQPEELAGYASTHFSFNAPPHWQARAEAYLARLERTRLALRRVSGRKGPRRTRVSWRPGRNARSRVGGQSSWMNLPFKGLRERHGFFANPNHVEHEMAHTFNFNHGSPMNRVVRDVKAELDRWGWWLFDHPEHVPDPVPSDFGR